MKYKVQDETFRGDADLAERVQLWVESQDSAVTVRRVFYAMVSAQAIENTIDQYRRISRITTKLRRGGRLDWDRIIDGTRDSYKTASYDTARDCVTSAVQNFRLERWKDQEYHVEVWTEKRGHIVVLYSTTDQLDVHICECGGKRLITQDAVTNMLEAQADGKLNVIIYVGDYDPSGLRMDQNMQKQIADWGVNGVWRRVALTLEQIDEYGITRAFSVLDKASAAWMKKHPDVEILGYDRESAPLVNKLEKDENAQWFRDQHGGELFQVEVDALDVSILRDLVQDSITEYMDLGAYDLVIAEEDRQRDEITALL